MPVPPHVIAVGSIVVFGLSLAYVLRPPAQAPHQHDSGGRSRPGLRGWAERHHSRLLALGRGLLNGTVATFGLLQVSYPFAAAVAEGLTAGLLSGFFQLTAMNERFSAYLQRASSEPLRVLKWVWFQAIFYGLVKAAGTLLGGGFSEVNTLALAYALTIVFGAAQYPWEAAIACRRALKTAEGSPRVHVRFVADVQTMAVSVTCVGVSILNAAGVPGSRLFLTGVGVTGLAYYVLVRARWALLRNNPRAPRWSAA